MNQTLGQQCGGRAFQVSSAPSVLCSELARIEQVAGVRCEACPPEASVADPGSSRDR